MNYILDTNIVSELIAQKPNDRVLDWVRGVEETRLYLSVITLGELRKGIEKLREPARKEVLRAWLFDEVLPRFAGRILSLDAEVLLEWGQIVAQLEAQGKPRPAMDTLLAATAVSKGFLIVTRNVGDFDGTGAKTLNPWLSF